MIPFPTFQPNFGPFRIAATFAVIVLPCVLPLAGHSRPRPQPKPRPAAAASRDSLVAPPDSAFDQLRAAMGRAGASPAAWDSLRDLHYRVETIQYGADSLVRTQESERWVRPGNGDLFRMEVRRAGEVVVAFAAGDSSWAFERDSSVAGARSAGFGRQQRELDLTLFQMATRLARGGPGVRWPSRELRPIQLELDREEGRPDLWRLELGDEGLRIRRAWWWHYTRDRVPARHRVELDGYQQVGGIAVATRRRFYDGASGALTMVMRLSGLEANAGIRDSVFLERGPIGGSSGR